MNNKNIYSKEELYCLTGGNNGTLSTRITPSVINVLSLNETFVFGSNAQGMHTGGEARVAYNEFGAEWGNGEGIQGQLMLFRPWTEKTQQKQLLKDSLNLPESI